MAIQNRGGAYTDFDPSKLLPREYAIVLSGDPSDVDGCAIYMCFASGVVKRLVLVDELEDNLSNKQDSLTFDTTPTAGSTNPVTSAGIRTALNTKQGTLTFDNSPQANSTNPVTSAGIKTALDGKQNTLTFDNSPQLNSTNPVTSSGIKSALNGKQDELTFDDTPTANSSNPVTSAGIKAALNSIKWTDIDERPAIIPGTGTNSIIESGSSNNSADGSRSHSEGYHTSADGSYSHAEGYYTTASGNYGSHAEGDETTASGNYSHAEGLNTTASGYGSHAEGSYTIAGKKDQHVFGSYNIEDPSSVSGSSRGTYIEIVGNGGTAETRSNARTLDWSGNETLAGKLSLGSAPTANMDATTKKYVDDAIDDAVDGLESISFSDPNNDGNIVVTLGS